MCMTSDLCVMQGKMTVNFPYDGEFVTAVHCFAVFTPSNYFLTLLPRDVCTFLNRPKQTFPKQACGLTAPSQKWAPSYETKPGFANQKRNICKPQSC